MNRKFLVSLALIVALFSVACGSMNRVTPAGMDKVSMEADIRGKIAQAVPEKTFAVEVKVGDGGVVTLDGNAKTSGDIAKIVDAANSVSGVTRVINNLQIQ